MNPAELKRGGETCMQFDQKDNTVIQVINKMDKQNSQQNFLFNRVFNTNSSQKEVYDQAVRPIIDSFLEGYNGTVLSYGQTASGKTHTMFGPNSIIDDIETQGIIPRMLRTIFCSIESAQANVEFAVSVSMSEVYLERINDLLDPSKMDLEVREDKV